MRSEGAIVALDIGTSKTRVVVGRRANGTISVEALAEAPSQGLRKGLIKDEEAVSAAIRAAVQEAENASGMRIHEVYTGIAGNHVQLCESEGVVDVATGVVSSRDIDRAIDAARRLCLPLDRELIHAIPVEFIVDERSGVGNPVGMACRRLRSRVRLVTAAATDLQCTVRCCAVAGLEVRGVVLNPLASALAVLSNEEKQHGVILLDVGAGTTDIAVYEAGVLRHSSVIPVGGNHVTGDIGIGLNLPYEEAERVKREHGAAMLCLSRDAGVGVRVAGHDSIVIPKRYVLEIIAPRVEELLKIVSCEIRVCGAYEIATYGIVLTGGASLMSSFDRLCELVTGMPVRVGIPEGVGGHEYVRDPALATAVGILLHEGPEQDSQADAGEEELGAIERTVSWA
ncbi:MAG: cell division protein FtsA, partial [Thermodesulfovibrionales bacterium]